MPPYRLPALASLALLAGCGGHAFTSLGSVTGRVSGTSPSRLLIRLDSGTVQLVAAEGSQEVAVSAEVLVREDRYEAERGAPLRFEDHVALASHGGAVTIGSAHAGRADAGNWRLQLRIAVPGTVAIDAQVGAGELDVALPAIRAVQARVGAGEVKISADRIEDRALARVDAGSVLLEVRRTAPREGAELSSETGQVIASLPPGVAGMFALQVEVGQVSVAARYGLAVERENAGARARGRVGERGEPAHYSLRSKVGHVVLR